MTCSTKHKNRWYNNSMLSTNKAEWISFEQNESKMQSLQTRYTSSKTHQVPVLRRNRFCHRRRSGIYGRRNPRGRNRGIDNSEMPLLRRETTDQISIRADKMQKMLQGISSSRKSRFTILSRAVALLFLKYVQVQSISRLICTFNRKASPTSLEYT